MKYKKIIISVLLTLIILFFLFRIINIKDIVLAFSRISFFIFFFSFTAYLLSYVFRTLRFTELNKKNIGFRRMFVIVCIHNFFNNLIPARIGELSYIYLVGKQKNSSTEKGIATLILARLMDLFLILLFTLLVLLIFKPEFDASKMTYFTIITFIILIFVISFLIFYYRKRLVILTNRIVEMIRLKKVKIFMKLLDKLKKTQEYSRKEISKSIISKSILYSVCIILLQYISFYIMVVGLGLDISFIKVIFVSVIVLIVIILPIQGVGGFGTYEGAWVLALIYLGFPPKVSITTSFVVHILQIAFYTILGTAGFICYKVIKNKH